VDKTNSKTPREHARFCPGGTPGNSPTFQRWESASSVTLVPKGRLRECATFRSSLRDFGVSLISHPTLKRWAIIEPSLQDEDEIVVALDCKRALPRESLEK